MPRAERLQLILSLLRSSPGMRPGEEALALRVAASRGVKRRALAPAYLSG